MDQFTERKQAYYDLNRLWHYLDKNWPRELGKGGSTVDITIGILERVGRELHELKVEHGRLLNGE